MNELTKFLSHFPLFQNEKKLILHLEEFLIKEYKVNPLIVFSTQDLFPEIEIDKCRSVLGKLNHLQKYSSELINVIMIKKNDFKNQSYKMIKSENCFYYYLSCGLKRNQFYFAFFTSETEIPSEVLDDLSHFMAGYLKIIERFDELYKSQELIHIDDVTGLYNQRKLYKDLDSLIGKYQKEKSPFCVLFIDIDHFKKVNDNFGHLVGTKLLENVANDLKSLLRDTDLSYRYGGDEFVVILSDSDSSSGKIVGERILEKIRSQDYIVDIRNESNKIKLSVSIGVSEFPVDATNVQEVLLIADRMMYEAKESGRGLVFNTQDVFKSTLKKVIQQK